MDCRPSDEESDNEGSIQTLHEQNGCEPSQFKLGRMKVDHNLSQQHTFMEANPHWVVITLDISNVFNEIQRYSILEELWENTKLRPLWYYNVRNMMISGFISLGYGTFMKAATYRIGEG